MSDNTRRIDATPDEVWAVLADGWQYATWVVGAARIRAVDDGWPGVGTCVHHSVGPWPLMLHDDTQVEEARPPHYLRLRVRAWPTGEGVVELTVDPDGTDGTGSVVHLHERAESGPASLLPKAIVDPVLRWRNTETLRRLGYLVEGRVSRPVP